MILTFEDLIINIFVKIDDFHKNISPLINKQYFIENSNNGSNKKRIYKHRIDTLTESEIITTARIKNVYNYFTNVLSGILAYQIKVRMKLG